MATEYLFTECSECGSAGGAASVVEDDRSLSFSSSLLRHSEPRQATGLHRERTWLFVCQLTTLCFV